MRNKAKLWSKHKLWIFVSIFVVISLSIDTSSSVAFNYTNDSTAHFDKREWTKMEESIRFNVDGSWFNNPNLASHPSMHNNIFTLPSLNQTENFTRTFGLVANEPVYIYLEAPEGDLDLYFSFNNQIIALSTNDAGSDEWISEYLPAEEGNYTVMIYHDERDSSDQYAGGTLYIHQNLVYAGCYFDAYFEGKVGGVGAEQEHTRMYFRVDSDFESIEVKAPDTLDFYQINVFRRTSYMEPSPFSPIHHDEETDVLEWAFGNATSYSLYSSDDAQGFGVDMKAYCGGSPGCIVEIIAETGQGIATIKINPYHDFDPNPFYDISSSDNLYRLYDKDSKDGNNTIIFPQKWFYDWSVISSMEIDLYHFVWDEQEGDYIYTEIFSGQMDENTSMLSYQFQLSDFEGSWDKIKTFELKFEASNDFGSDSIETDVEVVFDTYYWDHYQAQDTNNSNENPGEEEEFEEVGNIPGFPLLSLTSVVGIILVLFNHKKESY